MSALENYGPSKEALTKSLAAWAAELKDSAPSNARPVAARTLEATADAADELREYFNSSIFDQAIESFHTSDAERALAAKDLKKYLSNSGLSSSDRVAWELHDDNWCVDASVTVSVHDDSGTAFPVTVSGHYDSETGFGTGVC